MNTYLLNKSIKIKFFKSKYRHFILKYFVLSQKSSELKISFSAKYEKLSK